MYIGAIDIGGTKTIVGIVNESGKILYKEQFKTNINDRELHFKTCSEMLFYCLSTLDLSVLQLVGIGINMPGMVDNKKGILIKAPYAGWAGTEVRSYFQEATGVKNVYVENDVNSCAIGELHFGYGKTYKNYLWMTVSTGIGGAIINEGKLLRGGWNCAGEFGHLKVEYERPFLCPCGGWGCLEAHGSGTAITKMVKQEIAKNPEFSKLFESVNLSTDAVGCAILAREGNETACSIYKKAAIWIGRGISYCVNILNPDAVIIGGGVASSLDLMIDHIRQTIETNVISTLLGFEIKTTMLGYEAALLGAASLILEK